MRIRKRQVPLPLSSLLPVPLSDLYFNRSPTATARYFLGGYRDGGGGFASFHQLPPPSPISDRDLMNKKEEKALDDDDNGDVDVKSRPDPSSSHSKNVSSRGESDSSTQVVEKNEKLVTLRKRRGFISFEDYEEEVEEEEEEASGGSKGKKKAKKNGGALEEGSRCSRVNGRGWRCCQQTLVGYSLCEHHLGKGRVRSTNKSGGGRGGEKKAVVVEEVKKKKRLKLGMVKARSISSLLGQTSSTGGVNADLESEISAPADQFAAYDKPCGCIGGKGFSYCCPLCDFDLHGQCVHLPQAMVHESYPTIVYFLSTTVLLLCLLLSLVSGISFCNLCNMAMDGRFWSHNCYACNYHIHASFAVNKPKPVAASAEKCGMSDGGRTANAESVPVQGLETVQTEQVAGTTEQVEDPDLRQQLELQKLQLELDMSSFNLSSFV